VGQAIAASGIPREEIFVTTKLWNSDHGHSRAIAACRESVKRLGLSCVDLFLIHWPVPELRKESWRALVELQQEGLCRSIGVSNYMIHHLEELQSISSVLPAVDLRWSLERGLVVLAKSTRPERLRENAAVFDFALGAEDLRALDGLDEGLVTGWDPTDAP
jgi:diketogulonate reductase-like aldo/keto reductase